MKYSLQFALFTLILTASAQAQTSQTITFDAIPNQFLGISPFPIAAQASSLLPVSFSSTTPTVCETASVLVSILSAGTCSITATQGGNTSYSAATPKTRSFTVTQAKPGYGFAEAPGSAFTMVSAPASTVVGDFNGDGFPDLATATVAHNGEAYTTTITVLLGNGSGGFTAALGTPYTMGSDGLFLVAGDFNGDGIQDLAVVNAGPGSSPGAVTVLLGTGGGEFSPATGSPFSLGAGTIGPQSIVVGDFNADGIQDLAIENYNTNNVSVLLGNGSGGFAPAAMSPFAVGNHPESVVVGDFNGDGNPDLATANFGDNTVTVLLGNGAGGFTSATGSPFAASQPSSLVVGDFNGDGKQDLAVATQELTSPYDYTVTVLLGGGTGSFSPATGSPFTAFVETHSMVVGDFNGDGIEDLATDVGGVLLGNGAGGFSEGAAVFYGPSGGQPVMADFNGDGLEDLALPETDHDYLYVLLGTGLPSAVSVSPASGAGASVTFTAVYSDPPAATGLREMFLLVNNLVSIDNGCYVMYFQEENQLSLASVDGAWITPALTPGVAGTASNGLCTLNAGASSVTTAGNSLTLRVALTFSSAFVGSKNVYLYANAYNGQNSGWVTEGTWTPGSSAGPPAIVSLSPNSGGGTPVTFTAVYSDPNGAGDLSEAMLLVNTGVTGADGCYVYYQPQSNLLYLNNDAGNGWLTPGLTPAEGGTGTSSNSQCTLHAGSSSVAMAGNNLTLGVTLSFAPAFVGAKNVYLYALGVSGQSSGWLTEGTWTPNPSVGPPAIVSLSPASGTGTSVTFQAVYSDPNGAGALTEGQLLVNSTLSPSYACYLYYQPQTNHLYLSNDTGYWMTTPALTPGVAGTASNSQCTLNAGSSSVSTAGNNLTLNVALSFSSEFIGPKNAYMYAEANAQNSGWVMKGTWTPAPSAGPPAVVSLSPSSGSGTSVTFQAVYSDPNGAGALNEALLLVNGAIDADNGCYVYYQPQANQLYLFNDAGVLMTPALTPEVAGTASNSQCTLNAGSSSVGTAGNNLTLNVALSFSGTFVGPQNVYLEAAGNGQNSGWFMKGTWTP
jgi:hypothetical protein